MKDRFRLRAWDKIDEKYIYDVQFDTDFRHIVHLGLYEVEQYTGVEDREGNRIYEGDILAKSKDAKPWDCYTVFWQGGIELQFQAVSYDSGFSYASPLGELLEEGKTAGIEYLVIGNIHENEELKEMLEYAKPITN